MIVSTKGRYALRVMIDLAEHRSEKYVPLKEVAARQEISEKYLENILKVLVQNGFLEGLRGKGGGYRLTREPDGYALLQYNSENYDTVAIQTYSGDGLLWSSAGEAQQYTYASYLTNTANGPLLTAHRDNSDSSNLSDVLDMEGNLLLRRLGSCYSPDDLPDDCFIARQGFDYGLMDSTGQWLYRESIFSSPSDDAGGGYLY